MPLPAGTGMDRRSFLLRTAGAVVSVYGASMLGARHFEEGIAQAAAASPNQPVLVSIFMEGGWDALSVLAPVKEARYRQLRPALALAEGSGRTVRRGPDPDVAPPGAGPRDAARRGQGDGVPGRRVRPARREPLHEPPLLGGGPARHQRAQRLDRALPRRDRRTEQPAAGPLARLQPRAGAGDGKDAGGGRQLAHRLQHVGVRLRRTDRGPGDGNLRPRWVRWVLPRPRTRRRAARRGTRASC